jgi:hypothetical protein
VFILLLGLYIESSTLKPFLCLVRGVLMRRGNTNNSLKLDFIYLHYGFVRKADSSSDGTISKGGVTVNNELARIWKEAVVD